ncbi:glycosyl hydrolase-like protein, partial [Leptotrombidium deliense]
YYPNFANYIADFIQLHDKLDLKLYAVSPQNEPEFPTTKWDGCVWFPTQTAKFVKHYLKPTLNNRNLSTKVIIGENANWNVANAYLSLTSAMLKEKDFDIYASHGYSLPMFPQFLVTYNQHVLPWVSAFLFNKERWITEASATDAFDASMTKGVQLATSLTKFLTTGNIN